MMTDVLRNAVEVAKINNISTIVVASTTGKMDALGRSYRKIDYFEEEVFGYG